MDEQWSSSKKAQGCQAPKGHDALQVYHQFDVLNLLKNCYCIYRTCAMFCYQWKRGFWRTFLIWINTTWWVTCCWQNIFWNTLTILHPILMMLQKICLKCLFKGKNLKWTLNSWLRNSPCIFCLLFIPMRLLNRVWTSFISHQLFAISQVLSCQGFVLQFFFA